MSSRVSLGLVPFSDDIGTRRALDLMRTSFEVSLGCACVIHTAQSPAEMERAFASGATNLVWSSPTLALRSRALRAGVPLVSSVREGVALYHGVLVVRADSAITSPLQLRGARAAWVATTSASGYLFARVALAGHGIDPTGLFAEERFHGSHGAAVAALRAGEAEVAATFAVFEGGDASKRLVRAGYHDPPSGEGELRVILVTPPIPAELWIASRELHAAKGDALRDAISRFAEQHPHETRRAFGAESFAPARPRELDDLRRQLEDAAAYGIDVD